MTDRATPEVVILGAGPAGICTALPLGREAVILEQRGAAGGLTCSFDFSGVIFDLGGHSFHTPHAQIRDLVYGTVEMYEQKREARCYVKQTLVSYPFQKHFYELKDHETVDECERGLQKAPRAPRVDNLEDYLYDRFGGGIAEHFLIPYNRKLWRSELRELTTDWTGERIATPSGESERFETSGGKRKPLQNDTMVAYPARGGFDEITKALAKKVADLRFDARVRLVDPKAKKLVMSTGEVLAWRRLVSTLPLNSFLDMIEGVPAALRSMVARLKRISLKLVCVVIERSVETPIQRIYNADGESPAHKIGIANNSSEYLRSLPKCGIFGEVAHSPGSGADNDILQESFLRSLQQIGLIRNAREVIAISTIEMPYAYPVPTIDRSATVACAKAWLEERGIETVGRFGEWAYINSDEAMFRGLRIGQRLAGQK
jgi:UDP-galactopyranose mutase